MTELSLRSTGAEKMLAQANEDFVVYSSIATESLVFDEQSHAELRQKVIDSVATLEAALFVPSLLTATQLLDAGSATILREFMLFATFDAKSLIGDEEVTRLRGRYAIVASKQQKLRDTADRKAFAQSLRSSDA